MDRNDVFHELAMFVLKSETQGKTVSPSDAVFSYHRILLDIKKNYPIAERQYEMPTRKD